MLRSVSDKSYGINGERSVMRNSKVSDLCFEISDTWAKISAQRGKCEQCEVTLEKGSRVANQG